MKRYMVFAFSGYYPSGGMDDFIGSFDTIEEAKEAAGKKPYEHTQILDIQTGEFIDS